MVGFMPYTVNSIREAVSRVSQVSDFTQPTIMNQEPFKDMLVDANQPLSLTQKQG